ncbi:hypothetical protein Pmani_024984 [Petrolisthes manimaculis]|uniref:Protein Spindly n=1 Tax=Petrolisthes manimaculis TaxID=1843537 RepID=A0AAE1P849_9EUCA|nr:hypothetical protein Pmani_024984 [Petrolisthes manimaculis]
MSKQGQLDIEELQRQLKEAEHNSVLAATFGKQLLQENHDLRAKVEDTQKKMEILEQEKHCTSLKLETKLKTENTLTLELEQLREQIESITAETTRTKEQALQKYTKKVLELEAIIGNIRLELQQSEDKQGLMLSQLKEAQERLDTCNSSILDQTTDETAAAMQGQILTLTGEKQDLEMQVSSFTAQLKTNKHRLTVAEGKVLKLESELEENECQCTAYYNALEKNKTEVMELRLEVESLRLAETDPSKKGNSLFAEVEDQRQAMEKQLVNYKTNYNIIKKQYDIKTQQLAKMKLQVASLLSMTNNSADAEYLKHLEESLTSARAQLDKFTKKCQELENLHVTNSSISKEDPEDQDGNQFFKDLYAENQKKIANLDQDLRTAEFEKVVLSDRILQLQRKLHQTETSRDASNSEIIKLRVKLEELATKKGSDTKEPKRVVEKIPGFAGDTTKEMAPNRPTVDEPQQLKEKLLNPTTPEEVAKPHKEIVSACVGEKKINEDISHAGEGNEENECPIIVERKKGKKCVQLRELVMVQECDGQVKEAEVKKEDGEQKAQRKRIMMKKLQAPVVQVVSSGQADECKQQ